AWPVRAGAIRGAATLGTREAAGWLVARLDKEEGRLVDDLVDALRRMSGEDIGSDVARWRAWLEGLPADWRAKGRGAGEGPKGLLDEPKVPGTFSDGPVSFCGVPSRTRSAVYCVQASAGWEEVREEVKRSVATLPDGAMFGVVAYDSEPRCFRSSLAEANGTNRDALAQWLDKLKPDAGADPYAGLMAALDLAAGKSKVPVADTMFLVALTKPPDGTFLDDPRQVMLEITAANDLLGIRIHCVGPSDGSRSFYLQQLANQFGGFHVNG
ncbi:MAG: VWA domain-containing protein, partial [Planctomycetes bacterium]|nr:VWA domain-containing protein [Planctomycetota bacterium]